MHLNGSVSINLVILVVILLLDGEDFLFREEDVFVPILIVPLEEKLLSVGSPSKQEQGGVPLSGGALSCIDRP